MEKITITKKWNELDVNCGKIIMGTALNMLSTAMRSFIVKISKDCSTALSTLALVANTIEREIQEDME